MERRRDLRNHIGGSQSTARVFPTASCQNSRVITLTAAVQNVISCRGIALSENACSRSVRTAKGDEAFNNRSTKQISIQAGTAVKRKSSIEQKDFYRNLMLT